MGGILPKNCDITVRGAISAKTVEKRGEYYIYDKILVSNQKLVPDRMYYCECTGHVSDNNPVNLMVMNNCTELPSGPVADTLDVHVQEFSRVISKRYGRINVCDTKIFAADGKYSANLDFVAADDCFMVSQLAAAAKV